jgi:hypothetical protein
MTPGSTGVVARTINSIQRKQLNALNANSKPVMSSAGLFEKSGNKIGPVSVW